MYQDAFVKLDRSENEKVLRDINPLLTPVSFRPETATILSQELPFYPGYRFLDIGNYEVAPAVRRYAISKPGADAHILNGTNEPVYRLNIVAPLKLTEDTVIPYVRFFFTYIRGRHGRFLVTESADNIPWREEPPVAALKAMTSLLEPLHIVESRADGSYVLRGCLIFRDALFRATIMVGADGLVTMTDETLLIENMPVIDDIFEQ